MRLTWGLDVWGQGDTFGYTNVSRHLHAALEAAGVEWDREADTVLHVSPPFLLQPVPGRRNVALTMWENERLPVEDVARLRAFDQVLVPCLMNRVALKWAGYRGPVTVVPLGVDPAHLVPVPARAVAPLEVLWVGAPSQRKGWDLLGPALEALLGALEPGSVRVTLKTSPNQGGTAMSVAQGDCRLIAEAWPAAELAALYRRAHIFVFPTRGEGFGLPVLEAMAAECLVLAPAIGGLTGFFDATVGWALPWHRVTATLVPRMVTEPASGAEVAARSGMDIECPEVDVRVLTGALFEAVRRWPTTAALRARARKRALRFTWQAAAARVLEAMGLPTGRPLLAA